VYHDLVKAEDLPRLGHVERKRIAHAIEYRLTSYPEQFGKPLRFTLTGLWSLRVGSYRVIYEIEGAEVVVLAVSNRRDAYEHAVARVRRGNGA
jgi:mRNA interferase RelE/StbE